MPITRASALFIGVRALIQTANAANIATAIYILSILNPLTKIIPTIIVISPAIIFSIIFLSPAPNNSF